MCNLLTISVTLNEMDNLNWNEIHPYASKVVHRLYKLQTLIHTVLMMVFVSTCIILYLVSMVYVNYNCNTIEKKIRLSNKEVYLSVTIILYYSGP